MAFLIFLILIVAIALISINTHITPILLTRISSIAFIYAGVLTFNALHIQSIGSGMGIYSGISHAHLEYQIFNTFLYIIIFLMLFVSLLIHSIFFVMSIVLNFILNINVIDYIFYFPIVTQKQISGVFNLMTEIYPSFTIVQSLLIPFTSAAAEPLVQNKDRRDQLSEIEFNEWLRGFSDAEACFYISHHKAWPFSFEFIFKIKLHRDDRSLLEYLQQRLKIGKIYPKLDDSNWSRWEVSAQSDVAKIIQIFDLHPLNTTKHLDFLSWREAFTLYTNGKYEKSEIKKEEKKEQILSLKSAMNRNRTFFIQGEQHKINITPYWFLGFTEGEGSFMVQRKTLGHGFSVIQTKSQQAVIEAISKYLKSLIPHNFKELNDWRSPNHLISIYENSAQGNRKASVFIKVTHFKFISQIFIPFLENLTFLSKKELDFKDWVLISQLKLKGLHLTIEGRECILHICNRMNNYRLTSNVKSKNKLTVTKEALLDDKIKRLLVSS